MSARVQLEVVGLEFDEGGNTIWIHGPEGTVLRIKCSGRITVNACSAPCAHADVMVEGDIAFCVPFDDESETTHETPHQTVTS